MTKLGAARISSFDDNTTEARAIKSLYDIARRTLLRRALWSFAKRRTKLAAVALAAGTEDWDFKYQYNLPVDFLRLIQVNDYSVPIGFNPGRTRDDSPYQIEGNRILTNFPAPLKIRYIADVTDPTKYDSIFIEAFASQIAFECCETVTQSNTKKAALAQETKAWIVEAMKVNQVESPPEALHDSSWLLSVY
ncbi:MAG: hypothetical protein ACRDBH_09295 [Bosea sp. (in: a-proteobacteria)]